IDHVDRLQGDPHLRGRVDRHRACLTADGRGGAADEPAASHGERCCPASRNQAPWTQGGNSRRGLFCGVYYRDGRTRRGPHITIIQKEPELELPRRGRHVYRPRACRDTCPHIGPGNEGTSGIGTPYGGEPEPVRAAAWPIGEGDSNRAARKRVRSA